MLSTPGQREFLPRVPFPGNNHLGLGGKPLYSSVVKRNATNPPPLNIETVLNLLNLLWNNASELRYLQLITLFYIYQHIILLLFFYIILLLFFYFIYFFWKLWSPLFWAYTPSWYPDLEMCFSGCRSPLSEVVNQYLVLAAGAFMG